MFRTAGTRPLPGFTRSSTSLLTPSATPPSPTPISSRAPTTGPLGLILLQPSDQLRERFIEYWLNIVSAIKRLQHFSNCLYSRKAAVTRLFTNLVVERPAR